MKNELVTNLGRTFAKVCLKAQKCSPEILIVAGVVGVVASTVMACKATTKVSKIMDDSKKDIQVIHDCAEKEELAEKYTKDDEKKDLTVVYVQTGIKLAKLYAPAAILGALSITAMVASNHILKTRNVALAAAYATADKAFKEYRGNVVERFGETVDKELRYNIKAKTLETEETNPETGEKKSVTTITDVANPTESPYMIFFDESCKAYDSQSYDYNLMTLKQAQSYANQKLHADGFVFLNDIYDWLGKPRTKVGNIVGWVDKPYESGRDGYVDFRVEEVNRETTDGRLQRVFILDFNVDGNILDLI